MAKPFAQLRAYLKEKDIDSEYLGQLLNRSPAYISSRMNAKAPWTQDEQYAILDVLGLSDDNLPLLFPRNGRGQGRLACKAEQGQIVLLGLAEAIMQAYGPQE